MSKKFVSKFEILGEEIQVKDLNNGTLNVISYGAKGDGITDDYPAFAKAYEESNIGGFIVVPFGSYNLSNNPELGTKHIHWLIENGTTFSGAGAGNPGTGNGLFGCTYITNPWLITSGDYGTYNLNNIECPSGGALNADSKELVPISGNGTHRWYNLEYRGANTGTVDNRNYNVELLNQVLNITGCKGIAQEIDLNTYANPEGFSVALFITGGGNVQADCTAIDITRDSKQRQWINGMSIRNARTGVYVDNANVDCGFLFGDVGRKANPGLAIEQSANGNDGIVLRRKTDSSPTGNLLVMWNHAENDELFAVGTKGDVRAKECYIAGEKVQRLKRVTITTESKTWEIGEHVIPFNPPTGYSGIMVVEPATLGFDSEIKVNNLDTENNTVTLYTSTQGTGTLRFVVICQ